jgi:hypothetical protein
MVQWQPFLAKKAFDKKDPVCAACKRTNRTRTYCRERNQHLYLPWCTVYVVLTALDETDPSTLVAAPSQKIDSDGEGDSVAESRTNSKDEASVAGSATTGNEAESASDDINDIAESRTFLVKVSSQCTSIHWLDLAELDSAGSHDVYGNGNQHVAHAALNDPQLPYYSHGMDYAAAQHQSVLKSHQQYFFQMQQRQHQYQPSQWACSGQADHYTGAADSDVAESGSKRSASATKASMDETYQAMHYQQQQQWALYYAGQGYAHENNPLSQGEENADHQHGSPGGDTDDVEFKRRRVE